MSKGREIPEANKNEAYYKNTLYIHTENCCQLVHFLYSCFNPFNPSKSQSNEKERKGSRGVINTDLIFTAQYIIEL